MATKGLAPTEEEEVETNR